MEILNITLWQNSLEFETDPNLFSPRQPDCGSLAMLDHVFLHEKDKVLDLGCGYGLVGIAIAAVIGPAQVRMVDIDEKAITMAQKNAQRNHMSELNIQQSDGLAALTDKDFTLILSNPPYHSDFSVAKRFIEGGYRHLVIGGKMIMVVKRLTWYKNKMAHVFGGVKVIEQDGYYILESQKRANKPKLQKKQKVKRKHKKRLERSKQHRK